MLKDSSNTIKVLLIEDDDGHLELLKRQLMRSNLVQIDVHKAHTMQTALKLIKHHHFDAILLDLTLPDSHGTQTFQTVFSVIPSTAIVILTSLDDSELAMKLVGQGAQDYLVKGHFQPEVLVRTLLYAIERKRHQIKTAELANSQTRMQMMREFIEDLNHDLRNPLYILVNNLYLLGRELDDKNELVWSYYTKLKQQTDRLMKLTEHIDDLSSFDQTGTAQIISIGQLTRNVADGFRSLAQHHNQQFIVNCHDNTYVLGFGDLLQRVIENLIGNAIQYTPAGGRIEVTVEAGENDQVKLTVNDNGIGISPDDIGQVFKRFFRGSNARSAYQTGSGLGLAIVNRIVKLHGGDVNVESTANSGTTFFVHLPRFRSNADV